MCRPGPERSTTRPRLQLYGLQLYLAYRALDLGVGGLDFARPNAGGELQRGEIVLRPARILEHELVQLAGLEPHVAGTEDKSVVLDFDRDHGLDRFLLAEVNRVAPDCGGDNAQSDAAADQRMAKP